MIIAGSPLSEYGYVKARFGAGKSPGFGGTPIALSPSLRSSLRPGCPFVTRHGLGSAAASLRSDVSP